MNEQAYTKLTPNRKRFVDAYIANGGHATDAYITSGYKFTNRDSAASAASRLLTDETIQQAIRERTALSEAERLILNKEIMDNLISKAIGKEQLVTEEDDTFSSTPKDADQLAAMDRLFKYYVISPKDELTIEAKLKKEELRIKLLEAEVELKQAQAEALHSGDGALDLIDLDINAILEDFEEGDEDEFKE